jgi:hypothetical protein
MANWEYWIGPLIALALALRLRPAHLVVLGLVALAGFVVVFNTAQQLYPDCEGECPPMHDVLVWVNTVLLTLMPALLLLAVGKAALKKGLQRDSDGPASARRSP